MSRFYARLTQIVVRHGIVDKLIGDEVMGLYFPPLAEDGRYVDAMVADAREIIRAVAEDAATLPNYRSVLVLMLARPMSALSVRARYETSRRLATS